MQALRKFTFLSSLYYCEKIDGSQINTQNRNNLEGETKTSIFLMTLLLLNMNCNNPVTPEKKENHKPVISLLTDSPEIIGLPDSVVVTCQATDPDGDNLVYDWITNGRVRIKGVYDWEHALYNTYQNSHVFYPKDIPRLPSLYTLWIQCFASDGKGKYDNDVIFLAPNIFQNILL